MSRIKIQEIIPLTIQGEGFNTGLPVSFIRLYGCPVNCSFCDTGYSRNDMTATFKKINFQQILPQLQSDNIVISGGEPIVNSSINNLLIDLHSNNKKIFIETSGIASTKLDLQLLKDFNVWVALSPKEHCSSTGTLNKNILPFISELKLIVSKESDFVYYSELINFMKLHKKPVYLQPEYNKLEKVFPLIIDLANQWQLNISLQTHKFIGVR
jgi:7-carboxy-7-deazaguanine synthase